jgi:hypothetical protein
MKVELLTDWSASSGWLFAQPASLEARLRASSTSPKGNLRPPSRFVLRAPVLSATRREPVEGSKGGRQDGHEEAQFYYGMSEAVCQS